MYLNLFCVNFHNGRSIAKNSSTTARKKNVFPIIMAQWMNCRCLNGSNINDMSFVASRSGKCQQKQLTWKYLIFPVSNLLKNHITSLTIYLSFITQEHAPHRIMTETHDTPLRQHILFMVIFLNKNKNLSYKTCLKVVSRLCLIRENNLRILLL